MKIRKPSLSPLTSPKSVGSLNKQLETIGGGSFLSHSVRSCLLSCNGSIMHGMQLGGAAWAFKHCRSFNWCLLGRQQPAISFNIGLVTREYIVLKMEAFGSTSLLRDGSYIV